MKRIATITVSGDIPESEVFVYMIADILERHALDLRRDSSPAGNLASGFMEYGHGASTYRVDWDATYEPTEAQNQEEPGKMTQTPTTGRTVLYRLSESDAERINKRREDAMKFAEDNTYQHPGWQRHVGNPAGAGDTVPLVIVIVWPNEYVNGQAILDGTDILWVTSAREGHAPGEWHWPEPEEIEEGR